ncbi:far upstream element-binding protein 1 [Tanacetum coccineum]
MSEITGMCKRRRQRFLFCLNEDLGLGYGKKVLGLDYFLAYQLIGFLKSSTYEVGVHIGKPGDAIRALQNSSVAKIQIIRNAEADPHLANSQGIQFLGSSIHLANMASQSEVDDVDVDVPNNKTKNPMLARRAARERRLRESCRRHVEA